MLIFLMGNKLSIQTVVFMMVNYYEVHSFIYWPPPYMNMWENCMLVVNAEDTWILIRSLLFLVTGIYGLIWRPMLSRFVNYVEFVNLLWAIKRTQECISQGWYQMLHEWMSAWALLRAIKRIRECINYCRTTCSVGRCQHGVCSGFAKRNMKGYPAFVCIDIFSKMAHFITCSTTVDVFETAQLFYMEVVSLHAFHSQLFQTMIRILWATPERHVGC